MNDLTFLKRCCVSARFSPDRSTRNGAVLVTLSGAQINRCNAYVNDPESDAEADAIQGDRDRKLRETEHAERRVLFAAASLGAVTEGSTLYCPFAACVDCARAICLCGVARLVRVPAASFDGYPERWRASIAEADRIMKRYGVEIEEVSTPLGETYFLDGKEWKL